jgi:D-3-phosphoglycerate dehydrogenase
MGLDVFVTLSTFAEYDAMPLRLLQDSGLSFTVNASGKRMTSAQVVAQAALCRGLVAGVEPYTAEVLDQLPRLACISRVGVGLDSIDLETCRRRGIAVCNTPHEPTQAVAELAVAMMLGLLRRLGPLTGKTRARTWQRLPGNLLSGKTVGIVGLGRIGRRVVEMLRVFNVDLIASDPVDPGAWAQTHGVRMVDLETLLERADIVSLHASAAQPPLRLGPAELAKIRPGGWLINLARGAMLDDIALAEAIRTGRIAGAGLDVFPEEPYQGPLCDLENVILTPHQATLTYETRVGMETQAVRNLLQVLTPPQR